MGDRLAPRTINTCDLLKKAFIQRYCPPFMTAKQLEDIHNFKQEGDESLYQAWERTYPRMRTAKRSSNRIQDHRLTHLKNGTTEQQAGNVIEQDYTPEVLQHQLPPKELNPRSFTLPCMISKFNFYAIADLGASINVMPRSNIEEESRRLCQRSRPLRWIRPRKKEENQVKMLSGSLDSSQRKRSLQGPSMNDSFPALQQRFFYKSAQAEEPSHTVEDSRMQQDQEFVTGDNDEQSADKEVTKADWFKKP
ncbi:hypothetical protein Tco_0746658 [Tanacetum coccineum]